MLSKELVEFFYEGAHIHRWNEHIRTNGFTELDNQAHKMIIAYALARFEEDDHNAQINWLQLIEGEIFELMHRNCMTDIKPYIYHKMSKKFGDEINEWAYNTVLDRVPNLSEDFKEKFHRYYFDPEYSAVEKRILKAASYLSTRWEFNIIRRFNESIYGIKEINRVIKDELEDYYSFSGVKKIALKGKTKHFIDLMGKLRFQKRWVQSPRIPETSVMGHIIIVAMLGYFCSDSEEKAISNFICGLFHDMPEALTRDIISPVKRSVPGLDEYIKEIEKDLIEEKLLPLLPNAWHRDIVYYTQNEFCNKNMVNGQEVLVGEEQVGTFGEKPVNGTMLKACDNLAAYAEIQLSRLYGITSPIMDNAAKELRKKYNAKVINGVDFGKIFYEL